jgi:hypothetical protein
MMSLGLYRHRLVLQVWLWLSTSASLFVSLASSATQFSTQTVGGSHAAYAFVISTLKPNEVLRQKNIVNWPRRSGHCDCPILGPDMSPVYSRIRSNDVTMCATSDKKQRKSRVLTRRSSRADTAPEVTTQQDQILNEFSAKAALILAEAGGKMLASSFKRRWKFTFPDDSMDRLRRANESHRPLVATALTLALTLAGTNRAGRSLFGSSCSTAVTASASSLARPSRRGAPAM